MIRDGRTVIEVSLIPLFRERQASISRVDLSSHSFPFFLSARRSQVFPDRVTWFASERSDVRFSRVAKGLLDSTAVRGQRARPLSTSEGCPGDGRREEINFVNSVAREHLRGRPDVRHAFAALSALIDYSSRSKGTADDDKVARARRLAGNLLRSKRYSPKLVEESREERGKVINCEMLVNSIAFNGTR